MGTGGGRPAREAGAGVVDDGDVGGAAAKPSSPSRLEAQPL